VGDGPARLTGAEAQFTLSSNAVDLEDNAVDLIGQAVTPLADIAVVIQAILNTLGQLQLMTDGHAPFLQLLQVPDVGIADVSSYLANAITAEFKRAAGGDFRIQLTQTAGCGIARVGEGLAADFQLRGIEPFEAGLGHKDFATHLQGRRPAAAVQFQRDIAHGAHVDADVFASGAVTSGGTAHQLTVLIQQADRQAVQFGFAAVLHLGTSAKKVAHRQVQAFSHPAIKLQHRGFIKGVAQAEHRDLVLDLSERRQRRAADPLRRRIPRDQFRMLSFQSLELVEQPIVLGVRNTRLVEDVVTVVVLIQFSAQFEDAGVGGGHGCSLIKQKSSRSCSNVGALNSIDNA